MSVTVSRRCTYLASVAALAVGSLGAFPLNAAATPQPYHHSPSAEENSAEHPAGQDGDSDGRRVSLTSETRVVLPNIDDDSGRCAVPAGKPVKFVQASSCHDGADNVVNGPEDAKDLTLVRLPAIKDIAGQATATLSVSARAKGKVRVFVKTGNTWSPGLTLPARITAAQLRSGMTFGVEATDVIRDARTFDGRFALSLEVREGVRVSRAAVDLQVAKLTPFSIEDVEKVVVVRSTGDDENNINWPAQQIREVGSTVPVQRRVVTGFVSQWAQDHFEGMYASMTQGGRRQDIRVLALSHRNIPGKNEWFSFRGKDVGVIALTGPQGDTSLESTGNVEGIGAYTKDGRTHRAGRLIMGHTERHRYGTMSQIQRSFFEANAEQRPIYLDTSFLSVGHVDEILQVVPAKNQRGWAFITASPREGLDLLKKVQAAGQGEQPVTAPPKSSDNSPYPTPPTVNEALQSADFLKANEIAQQRIEANVEILKKELDFSDHDFLRIPVLFERSRIDGPPGPPSTGGMVNGPESDTFIVDDNRATRSDTDLAKYLRQGGPAERTGGEAPLGVRNLRAALPAGVNGLSLSRAHMLVPEQFGPKVNGKDVFAEAITAVHAQNGKRVGHVDTYYRYHLSGGELHCGTNVFRKFPPF
ncbi:protein-arginine deiminase family protein [Austwickia chelonae]|uniref:protein-arginine deiminase family protein n=1 Tax=Austwickia chelonae TaxID=100225 RepID=UPI000E282B24|nr:protein-arginine deiminase family protein [Austwickia chelonae]